MHCNHCIASFLSQTLLILLASCRQTVSGFDIETFVYRMYFIYRCMSWKTWKAMWSFYCGWLTIDPGFQIKMNRILNQIPINSKKLFAHPASNRVHWNETINQWNYEIRWICQLCIRISGNSSNAKIPIRRLVWLVQRYLNWNFSRILQVYSNTAWLKIEET